MSLTYREKEITNVMRNINCHSHVCEMEPITQPYQRQRHDVMPHELFEILSWFFQLQTQHYSLLRPIAGLQQIVCLENGVMTSVWESFEHTRRIEIPHRSSAHYIESQRSKNTKVHGSVDLFHEAVLLRARADSVTQGHRTDESLHEKFTGERENNNVEGHKSEVFGSFPVVDYISVMLGVVGDEMMVGWESVGQKDGVMKRV